MATTPDPSLGEHHASTSFTEPSPYDFPIPLIEGQDGSIPTDQPGLPDPGFLDPGFLDSGLPDLGFLDPGLFDAPEPPFEEWNGFTSLDRPAPSAPPGSSFEEQGHGFTPITGPALYGHPEPSSGEWQRFPGLYGPEFYFPPEQSSGMQNPPPHGERPDQQESHGPSDQAS